MGSLCGPEVKLDVPPSEDCRFAEGAFFSLARNIEHDLAKAKASGCSQLADLEKGYSAARYDLNSMLARPLPPPAWTQPSSDPSSVGDGGLEPSEELRQYFSVVADCVFPTPTEPMSAGKAQQHYIERKTISTPWVTLDRLRTLFRRDCRNRPLPVAEITAEWSELRTRTQ